MITLTDIRANKQKTRITAGILIDNEREEVVTTISDNVAQYVVTDRADAYVVGLLYFAMITGHDICSMCPVSEEILWQVNELLIPSLVRADKRFHHIHVEAPVYVAQDDSVPSIVATGISCGVDSLYTILKNKERHYADYAIHYLAYFDVGAAKTNSTKRDDQQLNAERHELAVNFCAEYGYPLMEVSSNLVDIISKYHSYKHVEQVTYMNCMAVLFLANGVSTYYVSSSDPFGDFMLSAEDAQIGDLLLLQAFSTRSLRFYSIGGETTRVAKTQYISQFDMAHTYLNVCTRSIHNCTTCPKCVRTITTIDGLGQLEKYADTFDISLYKKNRFLYLRHIWIKCLTIPKDNSYYAMYKEILDLFKEELTWTFKWKCAIQTIIHKVKGTHTPIK